MELTEAEINLNNKIFEGSDFFITNITEWTLDVIMKEIIEATRRPKDNIMIDAKNISIGGAASTHVEPESTARLSKNSDSSPAAKYQFFPCHSVDYVMFFKSIEMFRKTQSSRLGQAYKVVDRAIIKYFDPKRFDQTIFNNFMHFADLSHFVKLNPTYSLISELVKQREKLFFEIINASSKIDISLSEPLMMLKLYFKEQHFSFMENVELFIPKKSALSFEIQYFESLSSNLTAKIASVTNLSIEGINSMTDLISYIINMSFHIPNGSIANKNTLECLKRVLNADLNEIIRLYGQGKICLSKPELYSLIHTLFRRSSARDDFLSYLKK